MRHRHTWTEIDICRSCGVRRCSATRLAPTSSFQVSRCNRGAKEQSLYCESHSYIKCGSSKHGSESSAQSSSSTMRASDVE
jgi:hypothetical protein